MENKTYLLKYEIHLVDSSPLLGKEMKVKNCMSELHAKCKLAEYLERKYINFSKLIVNSCKEDYDLGNIFKNFDGMDWLGDIFKQKK